MNKVPISDAKDIAMRHRSIGALVLTVGDNQFAVTTYGHTRASCDAMRKVNEQIAECIRSGIIRIPDELRT